MTYGASSFGSVSFGGLSASREQVFFPLREYDPAAYDAEIEFTGDDPQYSILAAVNSDAVAVSFEAFTRNDLGEVPQSQGFFGGFGLFFQYVVGSARFISVRATVPTLTQLFRVVGRPGD